MRYLSGFTREEASSPYPFSALQQGTLQTAITPLIRRQKSSAPTFIAKRHKTVHTFFDEF
ncbi:hypothetical protein ABH853_10400 [Pseudomonas sp. 13.2]|uniref:Uncharacterized protein n=1 Tax=Pseudomonas sp. 13.2 TaxID=3144665 RepID=A0AAU7BLA0_9PSED